MEHIILALNPGSTSTKFGVYKNDISVFEHTLRHSTEDLEKYDKVYDQFEFRKNAILDYLNNIKFDLKTLSAVVGRGGGLKPIAGGTYAINEEMLKDLREAKRGEHASNLGGIIANELAQSLGIQSFIADPPVVDELCDLARLTGLKGYERESKFHALNQKAVAKRFSKEKNKKYEDINLIVAHLGGGISVGAHEKGMVVDVNDAYTGDGSYSPERCGGLPTGVILDLSFSGKYSKRDVVKMLVGAGGVNSYLGINDMREVSKRYLEGDHEAKMVYEGMIYQISKDIGAMATVLSGKVDQIILTGGIAYDNDFVSIIKDRTQHISDITVYPGEDELEALSNSALGVLNGEYVAKEY